MSIADIGNVSPSWSTFPVLDITIHLNNVWYWYHIRVSLWHVLVLIYVFGCSCLLFSQTWCMSYQQLRQLFSCLQSVVVRQFWWSSRGLWMKCTCITSVQSFVSWLADLFIYVGLDLSAKLHCILICQAVWPRFISVTNHRPTYLPWSYFTWSIIIMMLRQMLLVLSSWLSPWFFWWMWNSANLTLRPSRQTQVCWHNRMIKSTCRLRLHPPFTVQKGTAKTV